MLHSDATSKCWTKYKNKQGLKHYFISIRFAITLQTIPPFQLSDPPPNPPLNSPDRLSIAEKNSPANRLFTKKSSM